MISFFYHNNNCNHDDDYDYDDADDDKKSATMTTMKIVSPSKGRCWSSLLAAREAEGENGKEDWEQSS